MNKTKLNEIKQKDHSYNVVRLISQLEFAFNLATSINDENLKKELDQLVIQFLAMYEKDNCITPKSLKIMEQKFSSFSHLAKAIKIHCVGHAHIDMNWMWGYDETVDVTLKTFRTVLNLMDQYPEFTFSQSQASIYEIIEKYDPDLLKQIKVRIAEGRWEVTASFWTESDKNMPSTESLLRHIIYTKEYLSNLLELDKDELLIGFEPDTFGHSINLPEILSAGGIKYYYFCRGEENRGVFRWKAPSGKEVLAYQEPIWYNASINPYDFSFFPKYMKQQKISTGLKVYGVGDHGGGPTKEDLKMIKDIQTWPLMPKLIFSTYSNFFKEIKNGDYPIYTFEMNPIFEGCYSSQAFIKQKNKQAEQSLYLTELMSLFSPKTLYDNQLVDNAWKNVLFNQFHDILTGSGTVETRNYAMGKYQEVFSVIKSQQLQSLDYFAKLISVPSEFSENGLKYFVFNPCAETKTSLVDIVLWDCKFDINNLSLKDSKGNTLEYTVKDVKPVVYWSHTYQTITVKMHLRAFEYDLINIDNSSLEHIPYINPNPIEQLMRKHHNPNHYIENEFYKLTFDANGNLRSILEKESQYDYLQGTNRLGLFRLIHEDASKGMTAWNVGEYINLTNLNTGVRIKDELTIKNRLFQQFAFEFPVNTSKVEVIYKIDTNSHYVDVFVNVDWQEIGSILKGIPTLEYYLNHNLSESEYLYDTNSSLITRPIQNRDSVAQNFILAKDKLHGIALVNNDNYGYRGYPNSISTKLIRSSLDPDKYPEIGVHKIHLGIILLNENASTSIFSQLHKFRYGLISHLQISSENQLPSNNRIFNIQKESVEILSIKKVHNTIILRLQESQGKREEVEIMFENIKNAYEADLFGNKKDEIKISHKNKCIVNVEPYEIKTIHVDC